MHANLDGTHFFVSSSLFECAGSNVCAIIRSFSRRCLSGRKEWRRALLTRFFRLATQFSRAFSIPYCNGADSRLSDSTEEPTSAPALKKPSKKALAAAAKAARAKAAAEVIDLDDSEEEPTKKRKVRPLWPHFLYPVAHTALFCWRLSVQARSAEDEDFKPPAVEEVSDEQEADDDASKDTEAPRKKPSSKRRKKASDDDDGCSLAIGGRALSDDVWQTLRLSRQRRSGRRRRRKP